MNACEIQADDFARRFRLRAPNLMWFLGAGASASAGVPTARDMIWEFKQQLYVTQRRVSPRTVADLSSPVVRARLQAHVDSGGELPPLGAPDEYAALFERVYPAEADRRAFLNAKTAGARPSYGHIALAVLMRAQQTRIVWTTNFDSLVADACAKVYDSTAALTSVTLDAPELGEDAISGEQWPVEVKLHGDFRSRRLKNTGDELRSQDTRLRRLLVKSCQRFGLVVVGYSGRDESVMEALEEVLEQRDPLPAGLFWLHRGDDPPLPRVVGLLARLAESSVDAALVRIENFDEVLRDIVRLTDAIETGALDAFASGRQRWTAAPCPAGRRSWPIVRLNALPLAHMPSVCRRVVCSVGGYAEVRAAVERASVKLVSARTRAGVLCYGADGDVRLAFGPYGISDFGTSLVSSGFCVTH
jgi:NAD-dependent SIR2 family protein deacetylase